jgi:hypothetical protein
MLNTPQHADGFSYLYAGDTFGNPPEVWYDAVTHPGRYRGTGGVLEISVGIDPYSDYFGGLDDIDKDNLIISTQNVINTWNSLIPTTDNLLFGVDNNIPTGYYDFESTLLHEMGHALGLGHPNLGVQTGVSGTNTNFTQSTKGTDGYFTFGVGSDGIKGSSDDIRGDDLNLNWFRKSNNDPFTIDSVVDSTTYSRDTNDLPIGHNYSTNADRDVAEDIFNLDNTEAVLQQGMLADEAQRTLGHDDVAGIRYAMSGLDELAGTDDDYTISLTYAGLDPFADISIGFNYNTSLAYAVVNSFSIQDTHHFSVKGASIYFNAGEDWFFNDNIPNSPPHSPEPSTLVLFGIGALGLIGYVIRRKKKSA